MMVALPLAVLIIAESSGDSEHINGIEGGILSAALNGYAKPLSHKPRITE